MYPTPPVPGPPPRPAAEQPVDAAELTTDIDNAVAGLRDLDDRPLAAHVERFDTAHAALTEALSRIDKV
ncbi:hypothetical protein [Labedaea rhizosphaerae]|uniref:Uncharacterized protein n=1 Tax=Labedaea rhizosphaerae TaxID=598644 RepID=A0A4R6RVW7_LABRH|nr:hypothetical protein [Labedaea rhizosphaerae]TDP90465.1 hypothetical protein EV186_1104 [Labedaea rhizosphaerae]